MIILIHTSKTMRPIPPRSVGEFEQPGLLLKAVELNSYLKTLTSTQIAKIMAISPTLADKTQALIGGWTDKPDAQRAAVDAFLGDIYSGLQIDSWTVSDRKYANSTLRILSGLYGILRPLDGICPYRLEMGYRLPSKKYSNLYGYWGENIVQTLPKAGDIINLAAIEYSKTVTPFVDPARLIAPSFLTISPKTGQPTFVTVHAKIARGAYASWLIRQRISSRRDLTKFAEIGYKYDPKLSSESEPVFVCKEFGGKGLSVRLT